MSQGGSTNLGSVVPTSFEVSDLVGLGKAARELLNHVANATGVVYRPVAIRKEGRAKAEAKAYEIVLLAKANAEVALIDEETAATLEQRAAIRQKNRGIFHEQNSGRILKGATDRVQELLGNEAIDAPSLDWLRHFMNYAENVNDSDLQSIWSEILARKSMPSRRSVSLMTLDAIRLLEPHQAELFENVTRCLVTFGFCWRFPGLARLRMPGGETAEMERMRSYDDLDVLSELKLVEIKDDPIPEAGARDMINASRFVLFVARGNRTLGRTVPKKVGRSVRGEELGRVVLRTDDEEDALDIWELRKGSGRAYKFLTVAQQSFILTEWFRYLWDCNLDCLVGPQTNGPTWPPSPTHRWDGDRLVPLDGKSDQDTSLPPELIALLGPPG